MTGSGKRQRRDLGKVPGHDTDIHASHPSTRSGSLGAGTAPATGRRADALADRLEQGAQALAAFAASLTDAQWKTRCMPDGRTVGVIVHHVAFVYPIEIDIAQTIANGKPLTGLTMDDVHALNAKHAHR